MVRHRVVGSKSDPDPSRSEAHRARFIERSSVAQGRHVADDANGLEHDVAIEHRGCRARVISARRGARACRTFSRWEGRESARSHPRDRAPGPARRRADGGSGRSASESTISSDLGFRVSALASIHTRIHTPSDHHRSRGLRRRSDRAASRENRWMPSKIAFAMARGEAAPSFDTRREWADARADEDVVRRARGCRQADSGDEYGTTCAVADALELEACYGRPEIERGRCVNGSCTERAAERISPGMLALARHGGGWGSRNRHGRDPRRGHGRCGDVPEGRRVRGMRADLRLHRISAAIGSVRRGQGVLTTKTSACRRARETAAATRRAAS